MERGSVWPRGKQAAVSLCFDGGLSEHLSHAVPLLDQLGLRATFFLSPTRLLDAPSEWASVMRTGHEMGNHSLYGVTEQGALFTWDKRMVSDDLDLTQELFQELFGAKSASFALPGWSCHCVDGDYLGTAQGKFHYVRSDRRETNDPSTLDPHFLGSFPVDMPLPDLRTTLGVAVRQGHWLILRVSHLPPLWEKSLRTLALQQDVWIAPIREVGEAVSKRKPPVAMR